VDADNTFPSLGSLSYQQGGMPRLRDSVGCGLQQALRHCPRTVTPDFNKHSQYHHVLPL
jgi:hypothetical protein